MAKQSKKSQLGLTMEKLAGFCKSAGFIYQNSEIYGGMNGFWDYGPMGCELKRNIRESWWQNMVQRRENVVGLESSLIMNPKVWEASGHVGGFSDPMADCKECRKRYRVDLLLEELGLDCNEHEMQAEGYEYPPEVKCTNCGSTNLTPPRAFNLMFQTNVGPVADDSSIAYLRPETAQGMFVAFQNIVNTTRVKVPFGVAQVGKSFRNEINPRNYIFRSREFEQMEMEFFIVPGEDEKWHEYWVKERMDWYQSIGIPESSLSKYDYPKEKLAHYASACVDIMYAFPFGIQELEGIAARGNFDLTQHAEHSGKPIHYQDPMTNEKYVPHVVEPAAGVDRIALAVLCEAYTEEWIPKDGGEILEAVPGEDKPDGYENRTVLKFSPNMAPIKVAIFPLLKNKPELMDKAREIFTDVQRQWPAFFDAAGNIGRRYRRQDEIGTPACITIDFDTLEDDTVTIRDRDTLEQTRIPVSEISTVLRRILG